MPGFLEGKTTSSKLLWSTSARGIGRIKENVLQLVYPSHCYANNDSRSYKLNSDIFKQLTYKFRETKTND